MHRNEREITDKKDIDDIIRRCRVCHLAMCDEGQPYVVPLNFGYDGGFLYFHAAPEGRKIDIIKRNRRNLAWIKHQRLKNQRGHI